MENRIIGLSDKRTFLESEIGLSEKQPFRKSDFQRFLTSGYTDEERFFLSYTLDIRKFVVNFTVISLPGDPKRRPTFDLT